MTEPIKPALTPEEWKEVLDDYGGDVSVPPYPPDEREEFYDSPRRLAARCLYRQPFGLTREDVAVLRVVTSWALNDQRNLAMAGLLESLADRIEALLPPENPSP